jgi:hypothetical protein
MMLALQLLITLYGLTAKMFGILDKILDLNIWGKQLKKHVYRVRGTINMPLRSSCPLRFLRQKASQNTERRIRTAPRQIKAA